MTHDEVLLKQLTRIADALERIASAGKPTAPDYIRPLAEYAGFDWPSINASVVQQDADGPTHVEWGGMLFTRRSPQNKFDPAIWYSRSIGRNEEGGAEYLRLITFREFKEADALPGKVAQQIKASGNGHSPKPEGKPASGGDAVAEAVETYHKAASEAGLSTQAAAEILRIALADPKTALLYLPYFKEAKARGIQFNDARSHLVAHKYIVQEAINSLPK